MRPFNITAGGLHTSERSHTTHSQTDWLISADTHVCVLSVFQVVAPTISSPVCQEQLVEAGKLVAKSVEGCVEASQGATNDEQLLKQVGVAATGVTQALNELLQHIRQYASGGQPIGRHGEATDRILDVTDNIFSSMGDAGTRNMFKQFFSSVIISLKVVFQNLHPLCSSVLEQAAKLIC